MRRILLSVVLAGLFTWFGFLGVWTQAERFPDSMARVLLAPFAPGLGVATLANRLGMNDPGFGKYWLIFYGVNLVVWSAIFYGAATVYVWRRQRLEKGSLPRFVGWPLIGLCVVVLVVSMVYGAWDNRSRKPVVFVVPDGFTGYQIELIEDPDNGIDVALVDGAWVFNVPASGSLRIRSREMLMLPHTESCRFAGGKLCTVEAVGTWWDDGKHAVDRWRFVNTSSGERK